MNNYLRRIGVSDDPVGQPPTLQDCIEAVLAQSDRLIEDVLQGLEAVAGQARPKVAQISYRAISKPALAQLRRDVDAVRATFGVQLRLALYHSGTQDWVRDAVVRFDDLQLLDAQQIDANIEFALAQQEVRLAVEELLPQLHALISRLLGWLTVQPHLNPLRPEAFARALRETLVQHVPEETARSGLVAPAAGVLGVSLRQLYRELLDWLRSHGVEPVGVVHAGRSRRKGARNPVSRTMPTLSRLRRLLSGELDSGEPDLDSQVLEFPQTVPAPLETLEDLQMVEPMMKRLSQRAAAVPAVPDHQPAGKDPARGRRLGQELGEEVVRLMLDNLAQDERLLRPVRDQVKRLTPVLLRLAQADPRFFSNRGHPARQLLDKLTHRSLAYLTESDPGFDGFLRSLSAALDTLAGSEGEAGDFAHALHMLQAQWAQAGAGQWQRQAEAARALLHAEQRNLLAQRLTADFETLLHSQNVPEPVAAFLRGPWAQVVAESQLSSVDDSPDPQGYRALVDDLLWSVQPHQVRRNRARLAQRAPALLSGLSRGLQSIRYPQEGINAFLDQFMALQERAVEASAAPDAPTPAPVPDMVVDLPLAPMPERADAAELLPEQGFWVADNEASEAGYLPEGAVVPAVPAAVVVRDWCVADLATGVWVELMLNEEWVRAQLTWTSPHRTLFMFTSVKGLAHSMTRRTMDRLRNRGLVRVVSDGHVLDSALDAVAQAALRNEPAGGDDAL